MEILIMAGQMLLGLSLLVGVHELGHMLAAKFFGMRVEKFFIGFPPKVFSRKIGETEYGIGSIPLGGFVKISGMVDESMDGEQMARPPQPWEFRSKPAWQRLIVMLGGIIMNVLTGIAIFVALTYHSGQSYFSAQEVNKYGIHATLLGQRLGLQTGDKIVAVNGKPIENFDEVYNPSNLLADNASFTVERDGKQHTIQLPPNLLEVMSVDGENFAYPQEPFSVGEVVAGSPAQQGGLQQGDRILALDGTQVAFFRPFRELLQQHAGKQVSLLVDRGGQERTLPVNVSAEGTIGFYPKLLLEISHKDYTFPQALVAGTKQAFSVVTVQLQAISKLFSGEMSASNSISGPIGIAQVFGGTLIWLQFWRITGMLSMVLAFMNLLPIPALDGGHVIFLLYEMATGRPASEKVLMAAQQIGMVLLLGLMLFAFGNDIYKLVLGGF